MKISFLIPTSISEKDKQLLHQLEIDLNQLNLSNIYELVGRIVLFTNLKIPSLDYLQLWNSEGDFTLSFYSFQTREFAEKHSLSLFDGENLYETVTCYIQL